MGNRRVEIGGGLTQVGSAENGYILKGEIPLPGAKRKPGHKLEVVIMQMTRVPEELADILKRGDSADADAILFYEVLEPEKAGRPRKQPQPRS